MSKQKRKLTPAEKAERRRRRREYMTIFISGKQKRVRRPPTIDGIPVDEFIQQNADAIWLLQNEEYEALREWEQGQRLVEAGESRVDVADCPEDDGCDKDLPF